VSANLDVQLSPVPVRLAPPDACAFHASLEQLLSSGAVVETHERHIRVATRETYERVLRRKEHGVCKCVLSFWAGLWPAADILLGFGLMSVQLSMYLESIFQSLVVHPSRDSVAGGVTTGRLCHAHALWLRHTTW
jgi:hypothetical protein